MVSTGISSPRLSSHRRLLITLAVLAALGLWFVVHNLPRYTQFSAQSYGEYWSRRYGLLLHIAGGLTALSAGIVQIWLGLTGRTRGVHRGLGRVYASGVLLGSAGAYYLALTVDPKYGAYAAGLFTLATAWLITTSMAIIAIRRRSYEQHREWMLRSYTVTFAFVTFRLLDPWLQRLHVASADDVDTIMAWACWSVPLLLIEPVLQLRRMRAR